MKIEITEQTDKPLLARKEIEVKLTFKDKTPSNEDLKKGISDQLKADAELIVIKHIYTKFGKPEATALAYIYTSKKEMESIEPNPKKEEAKPGAAPAQASAAPAQATAKPAAPEPKPAEAPKEAPAEEKKEESKPEEKSE